MCAYGYTHRKGKPVRRYAKVLICYEIGQQADYNHRLERLLIEASVTFSLLCPIDGYQQYSRWDCTNANDHNHTLCVPMGTHIGRVSLYRSATHDARSHMMHDFPKFNRRI
jgi:hypothetical protein